VELSSFLAGGGWITRDDTAFVSDRVHILVFAALFTVPLTKATFVAPSTQAGLTCHSHLVPLSRLTLSLLRYSPASSFLSPFLSGLPLTLRQEFVSSPAASPGTFPILRLFIKSPLRIGSTPQKSLSERPAGVAAPNITVEPWHCAPGEPRSPINFFPL